MNKITQFAVLLSGIVYCSTVIAGSGPEVIGMKTVSAPFTHWQHQALNKSECSNCHKGEGGGKIIGWGKEAAHDLCIPCHDLNEKGPVECKQCHK